MAKNAVNTLNPVMVHLRGTEVDASVHTLLETIRGNLGEKKRALTIFDKNGHALNAEVDADDGIQSALFKVFNGRMKQKIVLIDYEKIKLAEMGNLTYVCLFVDMVIEE